MNELATKMHNADDAQDTQNDGPIPLTAISFPGMLISQRLDYPNYSKYNFINSYNGFQYRAWEKIL